MQPFLRLPSLVASLTVRFTSSQRHKEIMSMCRDGKALWLVINSDANNDACELRNRRFRFYSPLPPRYLSRLLRSLPSGLFTVDESKVVRDGEAAREHPRHPPNDSARECPRAVPYHQVRTLLPLQIGMIHAQETAREEERFEGDDSVRNRLDTRRG